MILLDLPGVLAVAAHIQECDGRSILDLADLDAVQDAVAESAEAELDDLAGAAARLLASLVRRRPFPWHNRRIAVAAMLALLALNGHDLAIEPAADLNPLLDDVVDRDLPTSALAERLRTQIRAHDTLGPRSAGDPAPDPTPVREEIPMFERFTDRARRATVLAQEEARELGHNYIGTEHILLGLIHEGEGVAARALDQAGMPLSAVRAQVEEIVGRGTEKPSAHIPFTPRSKKVLELALREALQLSHNYIGTEHILLGVIREGEGVGAQALVKLGADLRQMRETILRLAGGTQAAPPLSDPGVTTTRRAMLRMELDALLDENAHLRAEVDRLRGLLRRHDVDPDEAA